MVTQENRETSKNSGTFWPLGTAANQVEAERMFGTLEIGPEGSELELESSRLPPLLLADADLAAPYSRCIVGALGPSSYVRLEELQHVSWGSHSVKPETLHRFRVLGDLIRSPHESLLSDEHLELSELHVEMDRLSDWFTTRLETPDPFDGDLLFWLQIAPPPEATFHEDCRIKYRLGRNLDKTPSLSRPDTSDPAPYSVHTKYEKKNHPDRQEELAIHWRDLNGFREEEVFRQWFLQYPELGAATRMLARSTPGRDTSESAEAGILLMAGAIQALMRGTRAKEEPRYEKFLEKIGMKNWGLDIRSWGKRIAKVRNVGPAHGWEWTDYAEVGAVYRFLLAALRLGILRELGLTPDQLHRIALRHRQMRRGLELESLTKDEYERSGTPGWIVKGKIT